MKKVLYLISGAILLGSCIQHECPEPEEIIETTYKHTMQPGPEGKEAHITSFNPATPHDQKTLFLTAWTFSGTPDVSRSFIDFDYSFLPSNAQITKATLTLYADTTSNSTYGGHSTISGPNTWIIKRVTSAWVESSLDWNSAPSTDNLHQITVPSSTSDDQAFTIDITELVKDKVANPATVHGMMMQLQTETPYRALLFCSGDHQHPQLRPKLELEYK